jgi:hypothetical protein
MNLLRKFRNGSLSFGCSCTNLMTGMLFQKISSFGSDVRLLVLE